MYTYSKLSTESQGFLTKLVNTSVSRDVTTSIALARSLGYRFTLPNEAVDSVEMFFNLHHKALVNSILSAINECAILDIPTVLDLTIKFYQYRYSQAFPTGSVLTFNSETVVNDFFGISKVFGNDVLKKISENPTKWVEYTHRFNNILDILMSSEDTPVAG